MLMPAVELQHKDQLCDPPLISAILARLTARPVRDAPCRDWAIRSPGGLLPPPELVTSWY